MLRGTPNKMAATFTFEDFRSPPDARAADYASTFRGKGTPIVVDNGARRRGRVWLPWLFGC